MTALPTCWYCPECEFYDLDRIPDHVTESGRSCGGIQVSVPVIPPGTSLPVILDALGHTYRELAPGAYPGLYVGLRQIGYVVDNPAPVEAPGE